MCQVKAQIKTQVKAQILGAVKVQSSHEISHQKLSHQVFGLTCILGKTLLGQVV